MVALTNFADLVTASIDAGIDIIFSGAGLPLDLPKYKKEGSKTKLVPIVSSGRAANILCNKWYQNFGYIPDALVVEGPLAGGHLGFKKEQIDNPDFQLEQLIPEVVAVAKSFEEKYGKPIPVFAGGGVYTGEDIYKFIKMGAAGVQMGTRFVATKECDASDNFKQLYLDSTEKDICIIESPVGLPGRAIVRSYLDNANKGIARPISCKYHCITTCDYKHSLYCIADALLQAQMGNLEDGFAFAGSNAYRVNEILTVEQLFNILIAEYDVAVGKTK
jgi:nitronate monooxygenase